MSDQTLRDEPASATNPGNVDAHTRRIRRLGHGAHGEVWLCEYLGAEEVRKYLAPELDPATAFREAVQTRAIQHPGVVKVHDVVADRDGSALRMEFVPGRDLLRAVDDEGVLAAERAAALFAGLADALDAAHRRGVMHRGITPRNVIVRPDGSGVLTDFGIRTLLAPYPGDAFAAPEVRLGESPTRAADVWSLGAVLYFACSGTAPSIDGALVPLPDTQRHVPLEFWRLLSAMLAPTPAERPDAASVARDLRHYVGYLTCPDCAQVFRFESIVECCPEPRCRSPKVVPLKEALVARRSAENALADCAFREAATRVAAARDKFAAFAEGASAAAELTAVSAALDDLERDHATRVLAITDLLANDRLIECAARLDEARRRFSRSAELRVLRGRLRQRLAGLHREAPERVQVELRARRFDVARDLVTGVEHTLSEPVACAELTAALGTEPESLAWLSQEVERSEQQYRAETRRARQSILEFRHADALDAYTRLERDFPDAGNRDMLDALSQAPADLVQANRHSEELLRQLASDPAHGESHKNLDLEATRTACRRLLSFFDPDHYDTYRVFVARSELLDDAALAIRKYVRARLEQAESAREQRRLFEELEHLATACHLVVQSDLYDLHEREHVLARFRQAAAAAERARNLHADAGAALDRRDLALAQAKLRELRDLAPQAFADFDELVQRVDKSLARIRYLRREVVRGYGRAAVVDDIAALIEALTLAEELYELSDDDSRRSGDADTARALGAALQQIQGQFQAAGRVAGAVTTEVVPLLYRMLTPTLRAMSVDAWRRLLASDAGLRRQLCAVAEAALPAGDGDFESTLGDAKAWQKFFAAEPAADILAAAVPPPGFPHPTLVLAQRLHRAFVGADRFQRGLLRHATEDLMRAVFALAPSSLHEGLSRAERELQRLGAQDSVALRLHGLRRRLVALVPLLTCAGAAAVGAFYLGRGQARSQALATVAAHLLPGVDADGVAQALAATSDGAAIRSLARLATVSEIAERTARGDAIETWSDLGDAVRMAPPAKLPDDVKRTADRLGRQLAQQTIATLAEHRVVAGDVGRALRSLRTAFALLADADATRALAAIEPILAPTSAEQTTDIAAWRAALTAADAVSDEKRRNVLFAVVRARFLARLEQVTQQTQRGDLRQILAATEVPCYVLVRTAAAASPGDAMPTLTRR